MVVLPVPARPCTPTVRSRASRIVATASFCPSVRIEPSRCAVTVSPRASAFPAPLPAFIIAIMERSAFSARSVTNARSERRRVASTRWPSRTIQSTASRISPIEWRPGEWASANASSSPAANTDCRSSRCRIPRSTISSAEGVGASSTGSRDMERDAAVSKPSACARPAQCR